MSDDELLAELLLRWEELHEKGQETSAEELCRDCPHLAPLLAERIHALKVTAWMDRLDDGGGHDPDPPGPAAPRTLSGRYRLDVKIAEGGFAEVWKGHDLELARIAHRASFWAVNVSQSLGGRLGGCRRSCCGLRFRPLSGPFRPPGAHQERQQPRRPLAPGPRERPPAVDHMGRAAAAAPSPPPPPNCLTKAPTAPSTRPNTSRYGQSALSRSTSRRAPHASTAGTFHSRCRSVLTAACATSGTPALASRNNTTKA